MADNSVRLKDIMDEMGYTPIHLSKDYETMRVSIADINRPALQLTGFYDYFNEKRIQIIGMVETTYLKSLSDDDRYEAVMTFLSYDIPALVVCHGCEVLHEIKEAAEKFDRNLFMADINTSDVEAALLASLRNHLAPRTTMHGVLVEVYGEGVLITAESGLGKSETALELIKRGHRLIADDAVEIRKVNREDLIGEAPEIIRYYMELRGIGVINVRHIYGMSAVKPETQINMVVHMEQWDETKAYDRLGLTDESEMILGVKVPKVTIPVRPGRNLAMIIEVAAMNNRQKKLGYNAAETLAAEVDAMAEGRR